MAAVRPPNPTRWDASRAVALREAMLDGDGTARNTLMEMAILVAKYLACKHSKSFGQFHADVEAEVFAAIPEAVDTWNPERANFPYWLEKKAIKPIRNLRILLQCPLTLPQSFGRTVMDRWGEKGEGAAGIAAIELGNHAVRIDAPMPLGPARDFNHPEDRESADPDAPLDVARILQRIKPVHREIVADHFGLFGREPTTMRLVGAKHGFSESRISQIITQSIQFMRMGYQTEETTMGTRTQELNGHARKRSQHPGVYWNEKNGKWQATASISGKQRWLGYHVEEHDAAAAIAQAKADYAAGLKYQDKDRPLTQSDRKPVNRIAALVADVPAPQSTVEAVVLAAPVITAKPSIDIAGFLVELDAARSVVEALKPLDGATARRVLAMVADRLSA